MRADSPANGMPNRYPARCGKCGGRVNAGEGETSKIMGTTNGWHTVHLPGKCPTLERN